MHALHQVKVQFTKKSPGLTLDSDEISEALQVFVGEGLVKGR
jgi:hypothetical protein